MIKQNLEIARYEMHPLILEAYVQQHNIFDKNAYRKGYKYRRYEKDKLQEVIEGKTREDAAFYFNTFFPAHFFKVCHAFRDEEIIGFNKLSAWIKYNPYLIIVDIGCGSGAASVSILDTVLRLREENKLNCYPINLYFIGIDPSLFALEIYKELMKILKENLAILNIYIDFDCCRRKVSESSTIVETLIRDKKLCWNQPSISQTIAIASNILDYLEMESREEQLTIDLLEPSRPELLTQQFASFLYHIFDGGPIDHMHVLTIDTKPTKIQGSVAQTLFSIKERFTEKKHSFESREIQMPSIEIINPIRSFWRKKGFIQYQEDPFVVSVCDLHNHEVTLDNHWQEITSQANLELTWARARQSVLRESMADEIEIRLFEMRLEDNLARLNLELNSYGINIGLISQTMAYAFPKNSASVRPRGLTWLEAEVIMIAIIQVVGNYFLRQNSHSYAYRLAPENTPERGATEFLYESWSDAWQMFRLDIKNYAENFPEGIIFKTDIKSYFTKIIQDRLKSAILDELKVSKRIEWLIGVLIKKEIPNHEPGKGLVQGSIGSGFWANLYLTPVDNLFAVNDHKKRRIFRYVDDIVVVVPNKEDVTSTKAIIRSTIEEKLFLQVNNGKTKEYPVSDFLTGIAPEKTLNDLNDCYKKLLEPLWIMNDELRTEFQSCINQNKLWWLKIDIYWGCLTELNLYISTSKLSRGIHNIVCAEEFDKNIVPLTFPRFPDSNSISDTMEWAREFQKENPIWVKDIEELKSNLVLLFHENFKNLIAYNDKEDDPHIEIAIRRLRFAANRLAILGLESIHSELSDLFCLHPWYFRDHKRLMEYLAIEGFSEDIWRIINFHSKSGNENSSYIIAVALRAIRFMRFYELSNWEQLIAYMFSGEDVAKLMATETWLVLTSRLNLEDIPFSDKVLEKSLDLLKQEALPERHLLKNYLLVIGKLAPKELLKIKLDLSANPLLASAFEIASKGHLLDLFSNTEPEIIRDKYYSVRQKYFEGEDDEFEDSNILFGLNL